jgi:hypothetical protein
MSYSPCLAVAVLQQLFRDPRHVFRADGQILPIRPEAGGVEFPESAASFPDAYHAPGVLWVEVASALDAAFAADFGEV